MDIDVLICGGGPTGSSLAGLLARQGVGVAVVEREAFPRPHVGECLLPTSNPVLNELGILPEMEEAGYVHRTGILWTQQCPTPGERVFPLSELEECGHPHPYSYNVERTTFDPLLLRRAATLGSTVLQPARVEAVSLASDNRVDVIVTRAAGEAVSIRCRLFVDASGRTRLLSRTLGLPMHRSALRQLALYAWFQTTKGVEGTASTEVARFHALPLDRSWAWEIPLQNGICSVGVVAPRPVFRGRLANPDSAFPSLTAQSPWLKARASPSARTGPWHVEAYHPYRVDQLVGDRWLLAGDAMAFIDPVFSSGLDSALHSALYASDAIVDSLRLRSSTPLETYEQRIRAGLDVWERLTTLFYRFHRVGLHRTLRPAWFSIIFRILRGNPYSPETRIVVTEFIKEAESVLRG